MKLKILMCMALIVTTAYGQTKTVSIPVDQLTEQQKAQYASTTRETASEWVGFGHEVGVAFNEGLGAVATNVDKFGATRVGTFIMAVIAWRMIGKDLLRVTLSTFTWLICIGVLVWSYRRTCISRPVLSEVLPDRTKKYTVLNPDGNQADIDGRRTVHAVFAILLCIGCVLAAFA